MTSINLCMYSQIPERSLLLRPIRNIKMYFRPEMHLRPDTGLISCSYSLFSSINVIVFRSFKPHHNKCFSVREYGKCHRMVTGSKEMFAICLEIVPILFKNVIVQTKISFSQDNCFHRSLVKVVHILHQKCVPGESSP